MTSFMATGEGGAATACTSSSSSRSDGAEQVSESALKNPFVGNVSQFVPLPPEHSGPLKKGDLRFDACFEGG